jgi:hypothetical protein
VREFLKLAFMKRPETAPNVRAFSAHFNTVAACVSSSILAGVGTTESRGKTILFWIKVLQHLRVLRSYEATLAVVAGLTSTPVNRLKVRSVFYSVFYSVFFFYFFFFSSSEYVGCGAGRCGGVLRGLSQLDGKEFRQTAARGTCAFPKTFGEKLLIFFSFAAGHGDASGHSVFGSVSARPRVSRREPHHEGTSFFFFIFFLFFFSYGQRFRERR